MKRILKGNLKGLICDECSEPLNRVRVKLYKVAQPEMTTVLAVAQPKETFRQLAAAEIEAKQKLLFAEGYTNETGDFEIIITEKSDYDGGAFEIDFECGSVPINYNWPTPPVKFEKPMQFHITVVQPFWKELKDNILYFDYQYAITARWFCRMLAIWKVYVICGKVVNCSNKIPIGGVKVCAFDVDLIQDDPLGCAVTNSHGMFKIWYTQADFSKTILSWLNVEWPAGPDLYFKIYSGSGALLLNEPRNTGHQPGRENAPNCVCVTLCVDVKDEPQAEPPVIPAFLRIGGYDHQTAISSAPSGTGLTADKRAFYSTVRLNGLLGQKLNGIAMEYVFEFTGEFDAMNEPVNWKRVSSAQIARTWIGYLEKVKLVPFPYPHYVYNNKDYFVNGNPGELSAGFTADGWIKVPQENDNPLDASGVGKFVANGNQINLITNTLESFADINLAGLVAGNSSTSTGKPLAQNKFFALRMLVREAGDDTTIVEAGICKRVAINNTLYDNLDHHPAWGYYPQSNALGVCMVDILQLQSMGCSKITNQLDILYTGAHPNLGAISVSMQGPTGYYAFDPIAASPDTFGTAVPNGFVVADLPPCAYIVTLSVTVLLTTGDSHPDPLYDQIAFCK